MRATTSVWVEAFAGAPWQGHGVLVLPEAEGLASAEMAAVAASTGAPLTVFVVAPRRDDCHRRLRVFTPLRELPLSVTAAFAAAAAMPHGRPAMNFEQNVVATEVLRDDAGFSMALARPVAGTQEMPDPGAVAAALGVEAAALDASLPVLAGNAGLHCLLVPMADAAALGRVRLQPGLWAGLIEKAKVLGALGWVREGDDLRARFVGPLAGVPEWPCEPLAAAALVRALVERGVLPSLGPGVSRVVRVRHDVVAGRDAGVELVYTGAADRDGAVTVRGTAVVRGEGRLWLGPEA